MQRREDPRVAVEGRGDPRPQVVRRPAAAEDEPVVRGPLAVDDQVPVVGESLPPRQPDLVPDLRGQRLGRDDQRVDRHHGARQPRQPGREPLRRAHDVRRPHRAAAGAHDARFDRERRRPLVEGDAATGHDLGQAADQSARVDGRAVGGVRRAEGPRRAQPLARLGRGEHLVAVLGARPGELGLAPREDDGAALGEVAVDALGEGHALTSSTEARIAASCASPSDVGNSAEHQPPLRPEAPNPATSASSTTILQRRVGLGEVVRRPEPGVAGTDDGDVRLGVTLERRPRRPVGRGGLVPERETSYDD